MAFLDKAKISSTSILIFYRTGNLTEYRDSITVDNKSESGNITANASHTNLANVKENAINAQNRIYSAPIHMRNNSKHGELTIDYISVDYQCTSYPVLNRLIEVTNSTKSPH